MNVSADSVRSYFHAICGDYVSNLPSHDKSVRTAAYVTWHLFLTVDSVEALPYFWRRTVTHLAHLCRFSETAQFCGNLRNVNLTPLLREVYHDYRDRLPKTEWNIALRSFGSHIDPQFFYDILWTAVMELQLK